MEWNLQKGALRSEENMTTPLPATLPLHSAHMLWLQQQPYNGREKEGKKDSGQTENSDKQTGTGPVQGSIFVPLFQLKVPPRLGGPPICPGPYAPGTCQWPVDREYMLFNNNLIILSEFVFVKHSL